MIYICFRKVLALTEKPVFFCSISIVYKIKTSIPHPIFESYWWQTRIFVFKSGLIEFFFLQFIVILYYILFLSQHWFLSGQLQKWSQLWTKWHTWKGEERECRSDKNVGLELWLCYIQKFWSGGLTLKVHIHVLLHLWYGIRNPLHCGTDVHVSCINKMNW